MLRRAGVVLIVVLLVTIPLFGVPVQVTAQEDETPPAAESETDILFEADGVDTTLLASGQVEQLPAEADRLRLERVVVLAGNGTDSTLSPGPELLFVDAGEIVITDDFGFSSLIPAGQGILLNAGTQYQLANDSLDDASLLRLAVVDGQAEANSATPIAGSPVASPVASDEAIEVTVLLDKVTEMPEGEATIFMGRATWEAGADSGTQEHAGPLGIISEEGALTVASPSGLEGQLRSGSAVVLPATTSLQARNVDDEPATAVIVGVVETSDNLFATPAPQATETPVQTEPAETPTPEPTPTPTEIAAGTVLYETDSSEGFDGWAGQGWTTVNGLLVNDGSSEEYSQWIAAPFEPGEIANYAVEAEVQVVRAEENYPYPSSGLVGRAGSNGAYRAGVFKPGDSNDSAVFIVAHDEDSDFASPSDDELTGVEFNPSGDWHVYRLEVFGNALRLSIDGSVVLETTDNRFLSGGRVGLWSFYSQVNVRSFRVVALSDEGTAGNSSAVAVNGTDENSTDSSLSEVATGDSNGQVDDAIQTVGSSSGAGDLSALLPTEDEVPDGLTLVEDESRSAEQVVSSFADSTDASQRFEEWGWQENATRSFSADEGSLPAESTIQLEVGLHRFDTADGAAQALPYFADNRAAYWDLTEFAIDPMGDTSRALTGVVPDGNEVTVYVQSGNVLIRVTAWSVSGDPTSDIVSVMQTSLAKM